MRLPRAIRETSTPLLVVLGFYLSALLLLEAAFALSDSPALRDVLFGALSLPSPPVMRTRAGLFFVLAVLCLLTGYALFLSWAGPQCDAAKQRAAWKLLALLPLLFLAVPPFLSTDVLSYYQQGWLIAAQAASPYATAPGAFGEFPASELMKESTNHHLLSPYGPLWSHLEGAVYLLSGGRLWLGVVLFKLLAAASGLLVAYLVWKILGRSDPGHRLRGTVLVGANPLVLIEGAGMAHNDLAALAVAFAGIALLLRGRGSAAVLGLAAIGASLLVKALVAIVPLALAVYWLRTIGAAAFLRLGLKAIALWTPVAVASSWSFVRSPGDIALLFGLANAALPYEIGFTPVNILRNALVHGSAALGVSIDPALAKGVLLIIVFFALVALMLNLLSRAGSLAAALQGLGAVYLAATVLASYWRQWYALWPLPFAALSPRGPWTAAALTYSAAALLTYAITRSGGVSF
jgi:hypothetical protein